MSINLLFSNPNIPLSPMNMNTWNAIAGPGAVTTVVGTANQVDVSNDGGTATLSFYTGENNTIFPNNIITNNNTNITAIGANSLPSASGAGNVAIGTNAGLSVTTGFSNIIIGSGAGQFITTGNDNICIGNDAYHSTNPTTGANICIGTQTGQNIGTTDNNVCIGYFADVVNIGYDKQININDAIRFNDDGVVCLGYNTYNNLSAAGRGELIVATGDNCLTNITENSDNNMVAIGSFCGNNVTTGNYNCLVGNQNYAFGNNVTGGNNVIMGNFVGQSLSSGSSNIVIGNSACTTDTTHNTTCQDNIVIGNGAANTNFNSTSANCLLLGNVADCALTGQSDYLCLSTNVPVLYGTSSQLQIPNFKNIWNTNATAPTGQFLTCDQTGNLAWLAPPAPIPTQSFLSITNIVGTGNLPGAQTVLLDFTGATITNTGDITVAGTNISFSLLKFYNVQLQANYTSGTTCTFSVTSSTGTPYNLSLVVPIQSGGSSFNLNGLINATSAASVTTLQMVISGPGASFFNLSGLSLLIYG